MPRAPYRVLLFKKFSFCRHLGPVGTSPKQLPLGPVALTFAPLHTPRNTAGPRNRGTTFWKKFKNETSKIETSRLGWTSRGGRSLFTSSDVGTSPKQVPLDPFALKNGPLYTPRNTAGPRNRGTTFWKLIKHETSQSGTSVARDRILQKLEPNSSRLVSLFWKLSKTGTEVPRSRQPQERIKWPMDEGNRAEIYAAL
jgi:hypothetical protein